MSYDWLHRWNEKQGRQIAVHAEEESPSREHKKARVGRPPNQSDVTPEEARRIYDNGYRNRNRVKINRKARERARTMEGAYKNARKRSRERKQGWSFTFESWRRMWLEADKIDGRPAWDLRGSNPYKDVMMIRRDTTKGWCPENCLIRQAPLDVSWDLTND